MIFVTTDGGGVANLLYSHRKGDTAVVVVIRWRTTDSLTREDREWFTTYRNAIAISVDKESLLSLILTADPLSALSVVSIRGVFAAIYVVPL